MPLRYVLAVLSVGALLLAGCGDDKKDSPGVRSVSGTGYRLDRPAGWQDGTKQGLRQGIYNFDLVVFKPHKPFSTNVNVLRAKAKGVGVADLRNGYRGELDSVGATDVTDSEPIGVDGEVGITYLYRKKTAKGEAVRGRQVLVVHDGFVHSITLTALDDEFAQAQDVFDAIMSSWRWS